MATLKTDMCSACSFVIPTMQPAMTAADLFAQWMSSASHNAQASAPFLSTFSQTPQQHYPAGHTLPQSMQPQCTTAAFTQPFAPTPQQQQPQLLGHTVPQPTQAPFANSAFTQPPSCHTFNTPHHSTAMPGFQPPPHYNAAIPNPQLSPPQYGPFLNYQPTPHSTSTTLVHQFHSNFQPLQLQLHHWVTTSTTVHDLAPHARSTDINKFCNFTTTIFPSTPQLGFTSTFLLSKANAHLTCNAIFDPVPLTPITFESHECESSCHVE